MHYARRVCTAGEHRRLARILASARIPSLPTALTSTRTLPHTRTFAPTRTYGFALTLAHDVRSRDCVGTFGGEPAPLRSAAW